MENQNCRPLQPSHFLVRQNTTSSLVGNGGAGGAAGDADAHGPASADAQPALPGLAAPWHDAALPPRERRAKTLSTRVTRCGALLPTPATGFACFADQWRAAPALANMNDMGPARSLAAAAASVARPKPKRTRNSKPGCKTPTRVALLWSVTETFPRFIFREIKSHHGA